ncbi:hypothetical protein FRC06_005646, partial [Ceratobasidium sp. 370]
NAFHQFPHLLHSRSSLRSPALICRAHSRRRPRRAGNRPGHRSCHLGCSTVCQWRSLVERVQVREACLCPNDRSSCCPIGGRCCGNRKCCRKNYWCYTSSLCCPVTSNGCDKKGWGCCKGGKCCPPGYYCFKNLRGNIRCCPRGKRCLVKDGKAAPEANGSTE